MAEPERVLLFENAVLKLKVLRKLAKRKKKRSPHEIFRNRLIFGEFHHLYQQLRADSNAFRQYTRMAPATFDLIVEAIRDECYHCTTNFQKSITVEERLLLTLR